MIKACLIGYGYWGPNLCRNFNNSDSYSLDAICDVNSKNLKRAKRDYTSVKIYKNYKKAILENEFDLVILATPTSTHYKITKYVLKKRINILVEKPLCQSLKKHIELNKIAKREKVNIFIDFPFIFSGSIKYVKNIIDKKKYGNLKAIESFREQAPVRKDTNVLWDLSIHDISIISHLVKNLNVKKIHSIKNKTPNKKNYGKIILNLLYNKNLKVLIKNSWNSPTKIRLIKFIFDKATIYCDENETLYKIKIYKNMNNKFNEHTLEIPKIDLTEPLMNLTNYISNVLIKKSKKTIPDKFNLSITKLMVKLDKS